MKTEAQILAHTMDRARSYTLMYLNHLRDTDLHRKFEANGIPLNSAFWLIAHLATTENGLLLFSTGGPGERFSWAKHFTLGAPGLPREDCPPFEEVFDTFNRVHAATMLHLNTLPTEALDGPNPTRLPALGDTVRDVITHAIRHEASHAGHLGWLCKLNGIRTM